ncbi:hypothetical protein MTR67_003449 [Solanum verrucosum]|uniref:Uncharacterized protein n=1 Tax=Solanum verrucosum TaxID=315347 RepID=A0AAF0PS21_SOLVR|nr:hypothetical protein MTR67_003449 [Solanum verrucosum]
MDGNIFPASVISLYCTYHCYSSLASKPRDYKCNGLHHPKVVSTSTLIVGLLTIVLSIVYSVVRAGSSTTLPFPPSSPRAGRSKLITSLASMYSVMLLTSWFTSVGESGKLGHPFGSEL